MVKTIAIAACALAMLTATVYAEREHLDGKAYAEIWWTSTHAGEIIISNPGDGSCNPIVSQVGFLLQDGRKYNMDVDISMGHGEIIVLRTGTYDIDAYTNLHNADNTKVTFGSSIRIDGVPKQNCISKQYLSNDTNTEANTISVHCILDLDMGQRIGVGVNSTDLTDSIHVRGLNLNAVRIH